ncbi:MAG: rhomboid family intramembrane serine protease [Gemmatimonadota bacterium]
MTEPGTRSPVRIVRLLVAGQVVVWVFLSTILTSPELQRALRFDPAVSLSQRPWSVLSYSLVHDSALHLGLLMGILLVAGPHVARRMGSRIFLVYYGYCAVGTAIAGLVLSFIGQAPPLSGALGPVLGVLLAWAWHAVPDEIPLDPLPFKASARGLVLAAALVIGVVGVALGTSALAVAHLGGLAAGYVFLRLQSREEPKPAMTPLPIRHVVLTRARAEREAEPTEPSSALANSVTGPMARPEPGAEVVNRLLDKISASGLESLTANERRQLAEYAERKRREDHH